MKFNIDIDDVLARVEHPMHDVSTHYDVFGARIRTKPRIRARLVPGMYMPTDAPEHHWLHAAFTSFMRVREHLANASNRRADVFCDIGTSSGLDAIGAWEALNPKRLLLTDIVDSVLEIAQENVLENCLFLDEANVMIARGDLAAPVVDARMKVDVAYANLPVLPVDLPGKAISADGQVAASFYEMERFRQSPQEVRSGLLELYWSFLNSIRPCLSIDGVVLCAMGGRQWFEPIRHLFELCGFKAQLAYYGVKPQEQAAECLRVYAQLEEAENPFQFFLFDQLVELDANSRYRDRDIFTMTERTATHDDWAQSLVSYAKTAVEADQLAREGRSIGHVVYIVLGTLLHN